MPDETQNTPAQDQMQAASTDAAQPTTPVQSDTPETAQSTTQDVVTDQKPADFPVASTDASAAVAPQVNDQSIPPVASPSVADPVAPAPADVPWAAPADAPIDENGNAAHVPAPGNDPVVPAPLVGGTPAVDPASQPAPAPTVATVADGSAPTDTTVVPPATSDAPVISADEAAQSPATASQPPQATIVATPDAEVPSKVVQVEQPATIPDPDANAEKDAVVPNPNLVTNQTTDIPAPINPSAIGPTPAPITHEEAISHVTIQQAASDAALNAGSGASASGVSIASAEPTHEGILGALMKDLEGIAAMGRSEIIALIDMGRARLEELKNKS